MSSEEGTMSTMVSGLSEADMTRLASMMLTLSEQRYESRRRDFEVFAEAITSRLPASKPSKPTFQNFQKECFRRNLRFSGESNDRFDVFLRDLAKVRRLFPLDDNELFVVFPLLLTGAAESYFEANHHRFPTWQACENQMKEVYLLPNYDFLMRRDLFLRTQCPDEKIDHYLSILENVNNVLQQPHTEEDLVGIAVHNLHPIYRHAVAGKTFQTIQDLARYCRQVENAESLANQYQPPPSRLLLDPMFAPYEAKESATVQSTTQPLQPNLSANGGACSALETSSGNANLQESFLKKECDWDWNEEQLNVPLKKGMKFTPVPKCPDFNLPFIVETDASNLKIRAVLRQKKNDEHYVVAYASRRLNKAEKNFSIMHKELLGVLFGIDKFQSYIQGMHFQLVTEPRALQWLKMIKNPTGKFAQWVLQLSQYEFEVANRKETLMTASDCLSRAPRNDLPTCSEDLNVAAVNAVPDIADSTDPWYIGLRDRIRNNPDAYPSFKIEQEQVFKMIEDKRLQRPVWLLVVPTELRPVIMKRYHSASTATHLEFLKTFERIRQEYYWPKMFERIRAYVTKAAIFQPDTKMFSEPPAMKRMAETSVKKIHGQQQNLQNRDIGFSECSFVWRHNFRQSKAINGTATKLSPQLTAPLTVRKILSAKRIREGGLPYT